MKKFGLCTILSLVAFCLLTTASPLRVYADSVTLTLENVYPGNNSGGVYTYPYNFSIDGSSSTTALMCYIYFDEIYEGETWTATVTPINSSSSSKDLELAYLFSVASTSTSAPTVADAQWAAWELFDTDDPGLTAPDQNGVSQTGVNTELSNTAFAISSDPSAFYSGYVLYTPYSGWPLGDGIPQSFIGDPPPAPEPSSLLLFGTGLLGLAFVAFRKARPSGMVSHS